MEATKMPFDKRVRESCKAKGFSLRGLVAKVAGCSWSRSVRYGTALAAVLLAHRVPATSLHWTADEGKTWNGPVQIDTVGGAYPSMVELPDGLVYAVYYEEGTGSSIRGVRLRVDKEGVKVVTDKGKRN